MFCGNVEQRWQISRALVQTIDDQTSKRETLDRAARLRKSLLGSLLIYNSRLCVSYCHYRKLV
jgi:hypothetical protein